jgi:hypothetical protein
LIFLPLCAQEIKFLPIPNEIRLHEKIVISLEIPKKFKREYKLLQQYRFPDIPDLIKENTDFIESDQFYVISQYYRALEPGNYTLSVFRIPLKSQELVFNEKIVRVKSGKLNIRPTPKSLELQLAAPDLQFKIQASQQQVLQGQALQIQAALWIPYENTKEFSVIKINQQKVALLQKIKSQPCLVAESAAEDLQVDSLKLNGQSYRRWTLLNLVVFPLDSNRFSIPSFPFEIVCYEAAKTETGIERKAIRRVYEANGSTIKINKNTHGLAVGSFILQENLSTTKLKTGKSFALTLTFQGEGNFISLPAPTLSGSEILDIYPPSVSNGWQQNGSTLKGYKRFTYQITPKEPGEYKGQDFFTLVYFNQKTRSIDTLSPKIVFKIKGESLKNTYISTNHPDDFYSGVHSASNALEPLKKKDPLAIYANILILLMLLISAVIVIKK